MSITRRLFLRSIPAAGAVVATPAIAEVGEVDPRERLDAAIAELKAAAKEIWPAADDWMVKLDASPSMPVFINAYDPNWDDHGRVRT